MKKKNNFKILSIISLVALFLLISCSPDTTPSLYDSSGESGTPAEITAITPASGYAGITVITLEGTNFAPLIEDNTVYFSSAKAEILSASETQLVVRAPIIYGDSLRVYTGKKGVEIYSNTKSYQLTSAATEPYSFFSYQAPQPATSDEEGNVYFSLRENGDGIGVWKITADSSKLVEFAPAGAVTFFSDLKYHSDGLIFGVYGGNRVIMQVSEGVAPRSWKALDKSDSLSIFTFDFDSDKNIWASGKDTRDIAASGMKIASFTPDKTTKIFEYEQKRDLRGLKVFNNYLYGISYSEITQEIVRFKIFSSDSLGSAETVFYFSAMVNDPNIVANTLTFSADGDMYIGTNAADGVMVVYEDGSFGTWYQGLILPDIISFTWTTGTNIFATRKTVDGVSSQNIYKIDMERAGAPEFGRD